MGVCIIVWQFFSAFAGRFGNKVCAGGGSALKVSVWLRTVCELKVLTWISYKISINNFRGCISRTKIFLAEKINARKHNKIFCACGFVYVVLDTITAD